VGGPKGPYLDRDNIPVQEAAILALGRSRLPAACDVLGALSALKIHAHDARLRSRIAELIEQRNSPALRARFARDFPNP
jgi:hypothetical protein